MTDGRDSLHLLSVDLQSAPSSLRVLFESCTEQLEHWLGRAAASGAPLVIVHHPDSLDLYSTRAGRKTAYTPLLASAWTVARSLPELSRGQARELRGAAVVRYLLRQAAGLDPFELDGLRRERIAAARRKAAKAGSSCEILDQLFGAAIRTAERAASETELASPSSTRALRELSALEAERIVEEEIASFSVPLTIATPASVPAPSSARRAFPLSAPPLDGFGREEPASTSRLKLDFGDLASPPARLRLLA
jgi:hypothetical protein